MSDKAFEMTEAQLFKKWHSERMGHPIGVHLGINAVAELEEKVEKLKSMLKVAVDDVDCYGEFTLYNHKKAKDLLAKLNQEGEDCENQNNATQKMVE